MLFDLGFLMLVRKKWEVESLLSFQTRGIKKDHESGGRWERARSSPRNTGRTKNGPPHTGSARFSLNSFHASCDPKRSSL
jgi:hypothetical protein